MGEPAFVGSLKVARDHQLQIDALNAAVLALEKDVRVVGRFMFVWYVCACGATLPFATVRYTFPRVKLCKSIFWGTIVQFARGNVRS